ncbi:MAG: 30S ribosomal protein S12 methylthiotransferase RimO [Oscillospiraceae bacterium]
MTYKVGLASLGCPKNQVDAEMLLSDVSLSNKYIVTNDNNEADIIIINTCSFIEDARKESIDCILEYCDLKKTTNLQKVVVAGCLAERYKEEVKKEIPEIDAVIGIGSNKDIIKALDTIMDGDNFMGFGEKSDLSISGSRMITTPKHYAYVKISEGCNKTCAFCAIPSIRGEFRSRTIEDIVLEVENLAKLGVKELLVVSQDTTKYGFDIYGEVRLSKLLKEVCKVEGIVWVRVMYCYPNDMTDEILETINNEDKIVKYLEIPIQHVDETVLKNMRRGGNINTMTSLIQNLRNKVKGIAIRTSFIVGFPYESDKSFESLHQFIKDMKIDRVGFFRYSKEEGTKAYGYDEQIDEDIKEKRLNLLMTEQSFIMERSNKDKVGKTFKVIVDELTDNENEKLYIGRTMYDAPLIDGKVYIKDNGNIKIGEFYDVIIKDFDQYDLYGDVIKGV